MLGQGSCLIWLSMDNRYFFFFGQLLKVLEQASDVIRFTLEEYGPSNKNKARQELLSATGGHSCFRIYRLCWRQERQNVGELGRGENG